MANKSEKTQIDLGVRKLKLTEFLLGIFTGIIISVIIDTYFEVVTINYSKALWIMSISFGILFLLYIWYKRIVGYPNYVEYECSFKKDKNWNWDELIRLFRDLLIVNLKKNGYWGLRTWHYRGYKLFEKIFGYLRIHISRKIFGFTRGYIYKYKTKESFKFLIPVPDFMSSHEGIIKSINETLQQLQTKRTMRNLKISSINHYYASFLHPFKKKGKLIN